jgi:hypothetical protein
VPSTCSDANQQEGDESHRDPLTCIGCKELRNRPNQVETERLTEREQ